MIKTMMMVVLFPVAVLLAERQTEESSGESGSDYCFYSYVHVLAFSLFSCVLMFLRVVRMLFQGGPMEPSCFTLIV